MPDPIWQCLSPLVAPWPLVRAFENGTPPPKPYATWSLRSATRLGSFHGDIDPATGIAPLYGPTLLRLEISLYGRDAVERAESVGLMLDTWAARVRLETWNLSLARMPVVNNLSGTVADPQNEERAIVELTLNATRVTDDLLGVIEHVGFSPDPTVAPDDPRWDTGCEAAISSPSATTQPPS